MRIYLFRHGEVHNPKGVLYGRLPGFHLNEAGRLTVRDSAEHLKAANISHIYTSPLERTRESSEIIREVLSLDANSVTTDERLIEIDCRIYEGRPATDLLEQSDYRTNPEGQNATERVKDAGQRILAAINDIAASGQDCIVVSHGDPIAGLLVLLTNDWDEYYVRYPERGKYTILERQGSTWSIVRQ